jgi:hypothetical protein
LLNFGQNEQIFAKRRPVMNANFYRSGQAAKQLGISSYRVRQLCEAGLISGAECTEGGQCVVPINSDLADTVGVEHFPSILSYSRVIGIACCNAVAFPNSSAFGRNIHAARL